MGQDLLIYEVSKSHTTTQSVELIWTSDQPVTKRPQPDSTQHSQQTAIHAPGEIRNHSLSRRAATEPRLRPRGYWDRLTVCCHAVNALSAGLNPICHLLALLGVHHFLHFSRIRVKSLTLRLLMSYIFGANILDVSRSHTTTHHSW